MHFSYLSIFFFYPSNIISLSLHHNNIPPVSPNFKLVFRMLLSRTPHLLQLSAIAPHRWRCPKRSGPRPSCPCLFLLSLTLSRRPRVHSLLYPPLPSPPPPLLMLFLSQWLSSLPPLLPGCLRAPSPSSTMNHTPLSLPP